ncbi:MAG: prepilin-type N-terminal cleavage/methylation domain-containing protein [Planctomycetota bacterium]
MKAKMISKRRNAFTLVEILIVVVILGILAAIVVPQFANATSDARVGNLRSQIQTLENQIELYNAREGDYPALATDGNWTSLIDDEYIKEAPINPFLSDPDLSDGDSRTAVGAVGDGTAWEFDATTGDLYITLPDSVDDEDIIAEFTAAGEEEEE